MLREECELRGVNTRTMQRPVKEAKAWAASSIACAGQRRTCHDCSKQTTAYLHCVTCDQCFCRPCLDLQPSALWSLGCQCPACVVEDARLDQTLPMDSSLVSLARSMLVTVASSLKPGTWALYQRCIADMLAFSKQWNLYIFPVDSRRSVNGLSLFFEHLRDIGMSWLRISHYRAAIRKLCSMGDLDDPFEAFPRLKDLCEGLKKRITLRAKHKEGITLRMVKTLLAFWRRSEIAYQKAKDFRTADAVLLHQVSVILGWCGMRRASEVFVSGDGSKGLRRDQVSYVVGSHVTLFIQGMKNDPYAEGNEIVMVWTTASGIPIGETLMRYEARLQECGVPKDTPFILPTRGHQGFYVPSSGKGCRDVACLRKGLQQCFHEFAGDTEILSRFSWHLLRRGGASHAFREHLDERLIMGHRLWRLEACIRPYMAADLRGKLLVTWCM